MVIIGLRKNGNSDLRIEVYRGSDEILTTYYISDFNNPEMTVSNSVLTECSVGEVIEMIGEYSGSVYGDSSAPYSTFTVVLLSAQGQFLLFRSENSCDCIKIDMK